MKQIKRPNKLSQKFDDLNSPIDKDKLWASIAGSQELPVPKKNGFPKKFFFLLAGAVIISLAYFLNTSLNTEKKQSSSSLSSSEKTIADQTVNPIQTNDTNLIAALPSSIKGESTVHENEKNTPDNSSSKNGKPVNSIANQTTHTNSPSNYSKKEEKGLNKAVTEHIVASELKSNFEVINTNTAESTLEEITPNKTNEINIPYNADPITEAQDIDTKSEIKLINPLDGMSFRVDFEVDKVAIPAVAMIEIHKPRNWRIDVSIGRGKHYHMIKDIQETSLNFDVWNTNTVNLESQFLNLGLTRNITKSMSIKLEASLTNSHRSFESVGNQKTDTIPDLVRGEGYFTQKTTQTRYIQHHKYQFINANLLLEKEINIEGLSFILGVGVNINASLKTSGNIFDKNNNQLPIASLANYKTGLGISPMLSAEIRFPLIDRIDLFANARYISALKLSTDNSEVEHKVMALYSNVGIGYRF